MSKSDWLRSVQLIVNSALFTFDVRPLYCNLWLFYNNKITRVLLSFYRITILFYLFYLPFFSKSIFAINVYSKANKYTDINCKQAIAISCNYSFLFLFPKIKPDLQNCKVIRLTSNHIPCRAINDKFHSSMKKARFNFFFYLNFKLFSWLVQFIANWTLKHTITS